jgi:citrate synthase
MFKVFWRKERHLTSKEWKLLNELLDAHYQSCFRDNASSVGVAIAADASAELGKAITAGIATMGSRHAPVAETVRFLSLEYPSAQVGPMLNRSQKVPGWGGAFQKDQPDPLWAEVASLIKDGYPELHHKLDDVTDCLQQHDKLIFPNPSAYTACVAIALGMPAEVAPYLFIYGRLSGWAEIASKHLTQKGAVNLRDTLLQAG